MGRFAPFARRFALAVLLASSAHGLALARDKSVAAETPAVAAPLTTAARTVTAETKWPVATEARLGGDESRTRLIMDFNRAVDMRAFTLADPYRVVVDLPQVEFDLPASIGQTGRGLVKSFRFGLVMQGGSRLVLDLAGPAKIDKAFMLDPVDGQPARLVLDLVKTDKDSFMKAIDAGKGGVTPGEPLRKSDRETMPATGALRGAQAPNRNDPRPLIVLDPGHGGIDSGAVSGGEAEKMIVLQFARLLRDQLEATGRYRVLLTRDEDIFIPLAERVNIARRQQATLFVSIHADSLSHSDGEARGATVYTLSERASDADAERIAEAENKADAIAGVDLSDQPDEVADILIDLTRRETNLFSTHLAKMLVGEIKSAAMMHRTPIKSAGFRVLRAADVPSVLIELGYLSNAQDLKLLTSDGWRERVTTAIARAINSFFTARHAGAAPVSGQQ